LLTIGKGDDEMIREVLKELEELPTKMNESKLYTFDELEEIPAR